MIYFHEFRRATRRELEELLPSRLLDIVRCPLCRGELRVGMARGAPRWFRRCAPLQSHDEQPQGIAP